MKSIEPKWRNSFKILVDWIVDNIEFLMVRAMALLAPIPSAWALYVAFKPKAGVELAWVLAIVIEFMGLCLGVFIAKVSSFNNQHPSQKLWTWTSWSVFTIYLIAVWVTIGASGITPYMVFPLFTMAGAVVIGYRNHMDQVEDEDQHKEEVIGEIQKTIFGVELEERKRTFDQKLEIERMRAVSKLNNPVQISVQKESVQPQRNNTVQPDLEKRRQDVLDAVEQNRLNISSLAGLYNVERSSIYNDLKVLAGQGKVHSNSQGWKPGPLE